MFYWIHVGFKLSNGNNQNDTILQIYAIYTLWTLIVTGGKESSLYQRFNSGSFAYSARTLRDFNRQSQWTHLLIRWNQWHNPLVFFYLKLKGVNFLAWMHGLFFIIFCRRGLYNWHDVRELHGTVHTANIRHPLCGQEPSQDQKRQGILLLWRHQLHVWGRGK